MANVVMAIVDGTGDGDDAQYLKDMTHSFCVQIAERLGLAVSGPLQESQSVRYERGPGALGGGMAEKADGAAKFLADGKARRPDAKLLVAGYSRGGSAVIMAAERLAKRNINIDGMFLFDPVARHVRSGGTVIPANVLEIYKVKRAYTPDILKKYDNKVARWTNPLLKSPTAIALGAAAIPGTTVAMAAANYVATQWSHPMRPDFGFTGQQYLGNGHFYQTQFIGSHGALGGVGWASVEEDKSCQVNVATFMSEGLKTYGISDLLSVPPPPTAVWEYTVMGRSL